MSKIIENYVLQKVIGSGQYGKVYKAMHMKTNQVFAVKSIKLEKFRVVPKLHEFTINEVHTLSRISNPNIVKFIEMLRTSNNVYLIYEYCNSGTLEEMLKQRKTLPEREALSILTQILNAFRTLQQENILHRDVKPSNILIHDTGTIKLADFGFCKTLLGPQDMTATMVGSPIYMAPEVLKGYSYNTKADVWSLGIVLFEMLFGYCPYEDSTIVRLIAKIDQKPLTIPKHINNISQKTEQLIVSMLVIDPAYRIEWINLFNQFLNDIETISNIPNITSSVVVSDEPKLQIIQQQQQNILCSQIQQLQPPAVTPSSQHHQQQQSHIQQLQNITNLQQPNISKHGYSQQQQQNQQQVLKNPQIQVRLLGRQYSQDFIAKTNNLQMQQQNKEASQIVGVNGVGCNVNKKDQNNYISRAQSKDFYLQKGNQPDHYQTTQMQNAAISQPTCLQSKIVSLTVPQQQLQQQQQQIVIQLQQQTNSQQTQLQQSTQMQLISTQQGIQAQQMTVTSQLMQQQQLLSQQQQNQLQLNKSIHQVPSQNNIKPLLGTEQPSGLNDLQVQNQQQNLSLFKTLIKERNKVLFQINVLNKMLEIDYREMSPVITYLLMKNIQITIRYLQETLCEYMQMSKQAGQKKMTCFGIENESGTAGGSDDVGVGVGGATSYCVQNSEFLFFAEVLKKEIENIETCLTAFKDEIMKLSAFNHLQIDQNLNREIFNSEIDRQYYKQMIIKYVESLSALQQQADKSEKFNLLFHQNETLDCLIIDDIYDSKMGDCFRLNENLALQDENYIYDLVSNKLNYIKVRDVRNAGLLRN